jgi:hypothetical protein
MPIENSNPLERVKATYQQLVDVALTLNASSDNLSTSITSLDNALRKLKIGIESWCPFRSGREDPVFYIWHDDIGYAKIGGKWGLALRHVPTSDGEEFPDIEQWPFNDAPRMLRVKAVDYIPNLLERLLKDAKEVIDKVNHQAQSVDILTALIIDTPTNLPELEATEEVPERNGKAKPQESVFQRKLRAAIQNQGEQSATKVTLTPTVPSGKINTPMASDVSPRPGRNNP